MPTLESIIADDCATYRKRIAELETENGKLRAALMQIANDAANTLSRTVKPST